MRFLLLVLVLVLVPGWAFGQDAAFSPAPWGGEEISGPVSEVDFRDYPVLRSRSNPSGGLDRSWAERRVFMYDRDGRVLSKASYDPKGVQQAHEAYTYDDQGRLLRETEYSVGIDGVGPGSVYSTVDHGYGVDGLLERMEYRNGAGDVEAVRVLVHDGGRLIRESFVRADGSVVTQKLWVYDADGRPVSLDEFQQGNRDLSIWTREGEGRVQDLRRYGPDGALKERALRHFDPWGRLVLMEGFGPDGAPMGSIVYTEGDSPRWSQETLRVGNQEQVTRTVYDTRGRVVEEFHWSSEEPEAQVSLFTYEDDVEGNWVRQVRRTGTRPQDGGEDRLRTQQVILRLIRYHDPEQ